MARPKKKSSPFAGIDFASVEERSLPAAGEALLRVEEATIQQGDAGEYIKWKFEVVSDANGEKGGRVYNNTSLAPNALWNLKQFFEAMEIDTDSVADLDLSDFVGEEVGAIITHSEWNGTEQARIGRFVSADEITVTTKGKKKKAQPEPEEEEEEEEEEQPKKRVRAKAEEKPTRRRRSAAPVEEDEEEEEEVKPKKAKKKKQETTEEDIGQMDQEELQSLIDEHELEVDLDDFKTLSKMRKAVIESAQEAELI